MSWKMFTMICLPKSSVNSVKIIESHINLIQMAGAMIFCALKAPHVRAGVFTYADYTSAQVEGGWWKTYDVTRFYD